MISSPATLPTILALTSTVMADLSASTSPQFEMSSATLTADSTIRHLLIRLPPLAETEIETADEGDPFGAFNASRREPLDCGSVVMRQPVHREKIAAEASLSPNDVESRAFVGDGEVELPTGLMELIAMAESVTQELSSPNSEAGNRYYPTYSEGESCSSKSSSSFESWEESYTSLEDCCEAAFSWDYDTCMGF